MKANLYVRSHQWYLRLEMPIQHVPVDIAALQAAFAKT